VRIRAILLFLLTLTVCLIFGHSSASPSRAALQIAYTSAERFENGAWLKGGERFPAGAAIYVWDGKRSNKLTSDFYAAADPEISFDGAKILFAGKKSAADPWQIWEIGKDGSGLRQIVSSKDDVVRPLYLPQGFVVYARRHDGAFQLEKQAIDGGAPLILFHSPGSALPTDVLRDGRILFESAYPLGGKVAEIYTIYTDGSGVESYRCDHGSSRSGGKQVSSGDIIFARGSGLGRFTSPLAHEVALDIPKGEYAGDLAEASDDEWIVSQRSESTKRFVLMKWNVTSKSLTPLLSSDSQLVEPRIVSPRTVPNRHPSALHDWTTANLLALNVYTSKYPFPKDSIATVRLYTMNSTGDSKVLGTAPVEKDGSFYLKVPGDQPLKFELLDRAGRTLKKQEGWMWARRGEQRICVGCHAGPEHSPDNAMPAVLLRSAIPADLAGSAVEPRTGGN
jgi:hypothetical protein